MAVGPEPAPAADRSPRVADRPAADRPAADRPAADRPAADRNRPAVVPRAADHRRELDPRAADRSPRVADRLAVGHNRLAVGHNRLAVGHNRLAPGQPAVDRKRAADPRAAGRSPPVQRFAAEQAIRPAPGWAPADGAAPVRVHPLRALQRRERLLQSSEPGNQKWCARAPPGPVLAVPAEQGDRNCRNGERSLGPRLRSTDKA